MDHIRIAIRDSTDSMNICFLDNKAGIKFHEATLQRFLKGTCNFLTLKFYGKDIDTIYPGCRLAFKYAGNDYWLTINSFEKNGYECSLTAYSLSLETNKEKRKAYKAPKWTFKQYLDYVDPEHSLTLGLNEVASQSKQLEWSGTDTILARLFSIANSFGAELEFVTELNDDYSLKRHVLNVYKVGNIGKDKTGMPIRVGKSLKVINYTANIDELYTAIRVHGKDGLSISGLNKKVYDDDKKVLYYTSGDTLYAPQARDRFPAIAHKASDSFICLESEDTEHSSKESLYAYMLGELKKHSEPKIDYETEGYVDAQIGDRMLLIDAVHYDPPLYVEARISEQTISLLDKSKNKTVFTNYERKKSEIANELLAKMNALIEENKVYDVQILTSNGYSFKNGQGSTTLTARVMDGPRDITNEFSVNWYRENDLIGPDASITVQASSINEKVVYRIIAYKDGVERGRSELTLINVNDGVGGRDGQDGTSVFNFDTNYRYKQSEIDRYGTVGYRGVWNVIGDTSPVKVGDTVILSVFNIDKQSKSLIFATVNIVNSTSIDCTTTALVEKGEVGPPGLDGQQGKDGADGIPGRDGQDGRTPYAHIAYADSADGTKNFSVSDSHRLYIGFYTDFNATDSTNPSAYRWTLIKGADGQDGADGLPGPKGADGRTPYFHTAYADSADGQLGFSTTNASGKLYMGTCTDYIQSDPTDYRAYTWVKIKGEKGDTGATGPAGRDGKGVKGYKITYQAGTSGVSYPTGNWSSTIPTVPKGQYLWSKPTLTYTDNTTSDTYSVAYFAVNGATGNGISSYTAEFYLSTSKTTQTGGSWSTTQPKWSPGKYLWTRYKIGYTNGSTIYTTPQCSSEWEAVNNLQIGGRNLLRDTKNEHTVQLSNLSSMVEGRTFKIDTPTKNGEQYVLSFEAKASENGYVMQNHWWYCYPGSQNPVIKAVDQDGNIQISGPGTDGRNFTTLTTEYKRYYIVFDVRDSVGKTQIIVGRLNDRNKLPNTGWVKIKEFKLEKGNKPTAWSPAPEDTQDQIDQANENISNKVDQGAYDQDKSVIYDDINKKLDDEEFRKFQQIMNELKGSYDSFVGEGGRYEKELQNAAAREQLIVQNLGEKVQQLNFINTYIRESEEGIVIGAKGNPMQMLLSKDSLSFMDGGQTVAYFSNQSFYINRGAVVDSLQVGVHKMTRVNNEFTVIQYVPN